MNEAEHMRGYRFAGLLCLFGFFLHIILSGPLLNALGMPYSGDEGAAYAKIHPGTYFIFLSFLVLLFGSGSPAREFASISRAYAPYMALLCLYLCLFIYILVRSGPAGTAFLIDAHMTVPLCALVLSRAPAPLCRKAAYFVIAIAAVNAAIGIAEVIGHFRIFEFDPGWPVLKEEYFRASALRGHPLVNASFTAVALFSALALRMPLWLKLSLGALFVAALMAFGSRASFIVCLAGLFILGISKAFRIIRSRNLSFLRLFGVTSGILILMGGFTLFIFSLLNGPLGERLMAAAHWDDSANSRLIALSALGRMTPEEIAFGASAQRILDITYNLNLSAAIENPWVLMFMNLGAFWFTLWLAATIAFIRRLVKNQPLSVKMIAASFLVITSTYNSFGAKDSSYMIAVATLICVGKALGAQGLRNIEDRIRLRA